jgi:soluble lytic murein transglycosylase-like protein
MTPYQQKCLGLIKANLNDPRVLGASFGLKPSYVMAHIEVECSWRPRESTDGLGSYGPMQVLPATARLMGVPGDQRDDANSILAGMRWLSACHGILKHWYGHEPPYRDVCMAYNEGPGNVEKGRTVENYYRAWLHAQAKWAGVDK